MFGNMHFKGSFTLFQLEVWHDVGLHRPAGHSLLLECIAIADQLLLAEMAT
jgi:hypothetical protein